MRHKIKNISASNEAIRLRLSSVVALVTLQNIPDSTHFAWFQSLPVQNQILPFVAERGKIDSEKCERGEGGTGLRLR